MGKFFKISPVVNEKRGFYKMDNYEFMCIFISEVKSYTAEGYLILNVSFFIIGRKSLFLIFQKKNKEKARFARKR